MRNICKGFLGNLALDSVSLAARPGEVLALVGENGAGKSTLLKTLAGAYTADSGEILLRGEPVHWRGPRDAQEAGVSIIYQELNLIPYLNVAENIFLGREYRNWLGFIDWPRIYSEARALLDRLGVGLDPRARISRLSVAQQQMVEIAKALSLKADVIVMDEPSAVLAGPELARLHAIIAGLKQQGLTIIYVSHRLDELFAIADRATVLKDGKLVGTVAISEVTRGDLIRMMVGRSLDQVFPPSTSVAGEVVLAVQNLNSPSGLHGINLELRRGEILGIAGLVGSGRTTLARALFGLEPISGGTLNLLGRPLRPQGPRHARDLGLALVPEDRKTLGLIQNLSVQENVGLTLLDRMHRLGFVQGNRERAVAQRYIQGLAIKCTGAGQAVQFLSGGNQQKVVLAKWLATDPQVIILDEPTRGVDVGAKFEIYSIIRDLAARGTAILMISSELPEVLGMSDRILVMRDGHQAGELPRAGATEEGVMALATGHGLDTLGAAARKEGPE